MIGSWRHRRLRQAVEAYLDGELPAEAHAEVARHLSICWDCNTLAETLRLVKESLRHRRHRSGLLLSERRLRHFAENLAAERSVRRRLGRRGHRPGVPIDRKE